MLLSDGRDEEPAGRCFCLDNLGGGDDGRVWPDIHAALQRTGYCGEPDVLARLRSECANYAVCASLLAGTTLTLFVDPPIEDARSVLGQTFGALVGTASVLLMTSVLLSTIIIVHP